MERLCKDCILPKITNGVCPVFNRDMRAEKGCPYFTTEFHQCDVCGNHILDEITFLQDQDEEWHRLCPKCCSSNCAICANNADCRFNTDQECKEPPVIMKRVQQGNMIAQMQVMNPARIKITCAECRCYDAEGLEDGTHCRRARNERCENYKIKWRT